MNSSLQKVSIIGLGRLGYPLATCYAAKGFKVIGVDLNPKTIEIVNDGLSPVEEPGVEDLLENAPYSFEAIKDGKAAVLRTDVSVLIVPTPSGVDGTFSTEFVLDALVIWHIHPFSRVFNITNKTKIKRVFYSFLNTRHIYTRYIYYQISFSATPYNSYNISLSRIPK